MEHSGPSWVKVVCCTRRWVLTSATTATFSTPRADLRAVAHVTPAVDLSNGERDGNAPDAVYYDLAASLVYREYLSGGDEVRSQRAFNPTVAGLLKFSSRQTLSLSLSDSFHAHRRSALSRGPDTHYP